MRLAAQEKAARYPNKDGLHCVAAAVDQCGFIGSEFHDMLQLLAFQAQANDAAHARPPCKWLCKWFGQISTGLAKVQAAAVVQSASAPCER